jgi:hypothetical protein
MKAGLATVLYLYGISEDQTSAPAIRGVDGEAAVEALPCAGLLCWTSRVAQSDFADNLARNMENLDWLAEVGVRHQRVVAAIAESCDVLPARFGTVFLSETTLSADVNSRKTTLLADLKKIRGAEEWGVKVFRSAAAKPLLADAPRSGSEYLKAKAGLLRERPAKGPDLELEKAAAALRALAVDVAPGGSVSGAQPGLQWHASFLVERSKRKKFQQVVEEFSREWQPRRRIECTGPWPPYSFVSRSSRPALEGR